VSNPAKASPGNVHIIGRIPGEAFGIGGPNADFAMAVFRALRGKPFTGRQRTRLLWRKKGRR
jgi:hypothetical protein